MNPGAFRKGTIATVPSNTPTLSLMVKVPIDFPPITGSFVS